MKYALQEHIVSCPVKVQPFSPLARYCTVGVKHYMNMQKRFYLINGIIAGIFIAWFFSFLVLWARAQGSSSYTEALPVKAYSEGYIDTLGGETHAWAYDQGRPLVIKLVFKSEEEPNTQLSVVFGDSSSSGTGYNWESRQDVATRIVQKQPFLKGATLQNAFSYKLPFPDGRYSLVSATYNNKPFKFSKGVNKYFVISRETAVAYKN